MSGKDSKQSQNLEEGKELNQSKDQDPMPEKYLKTQPQDDSFHKEQNNEEVKQQEPGKGEAPLVGEDDYAEPIEMQAKKDLQENKKEEQKSAGWGMPPKLPDESVNPQNAQKDQEQELDYGVEAPGQGVNNPQRSAFDEPEQPQEQEVAESAKYYKANPGTSILPKKELDELKQTSVQFGLLTNDYQLLQENHQKLQQEHEQNLSVLDDSRNVLQNVKNSLNQQEEKNRQQLVKLATYAEKVRELKQKQQELIQTREILPEMLQPFNELINSLQDRIARDIIQKESLVKSHEKDIQIKDFQYNGLLEQHVSIEAEKKHEITKRDNRIKELEQKNDELTQNNFKLSSDLSGTSQILEWTKSELQNKKQAIKEFEKEVFDKDVRLQRLTFQVTQQADSSRQAETSEAIFQSKQQELDIERANWQEQRNKLSTLLEQSQKEIQNLTVKLYEQPKMHSDQKDERINYVASENCNLKKEKEDLKQALEVSSVSFKAQKAEISKKQDQLDKSQRMVDQQMRDLAQRQHQSKEDNQKALADQYASLMRTFAIVVLSIVILEGSCMFFYLDKSSIQV